ncbi:MAG: ribosome biogenesis GTP-binding protein YihA/YsxC, partial [Candidatus Margulisiibacteriota bacterium]
MNITSATFIKGIVEHDSLLDDGTPQIAFIGRSNVGKSSMINTLLHSKDLARTSAFPGRTQQINLFLINRSYYWVDLPGYGYAKASRELREKLTKLIHWYLFNSSYKQAKIVLIIDAFVGPTVEDLDMLRHLENQNKNILVVANKVDKIKRSHYQTQLKALQDQVGSQQVVFCSTKTR